MGCRRERVKIKVRVGVTHVVGSVSVLGTAVVEINLAMTDEFTLDD